MNPFFANTNGYKLGKELRASLGLDTREKRYVKTCFNCQCKFDIYSVGSVNNWCYKIGDEKLFCSYTCLSNYRQGKRTRREV